MTFQHIKVEITDIGMVNGIQVGDSGKKRTGVLGQRVDSKTVSNEADNLWIWSASFCPSSSSS